MTGAFRLSDSLTLWTLLTLWTPRRGHAGTVSTMSTVSLSQGLAKTPGRGREGGDRTRTTERARASPALALPVLSIVRWHENGRRG